MTPKIKKALDLALEALEQLQGGCTDSDDGTVEIITVWCPEVIDAIKQALAAPVQEPFCFVYVENGEEYFAPKGAYVPDNAQPLYTTPPAQPAPVQEPFGYVYEVYCLPECAGEMEWVESFDRCEPDAEENIRNVTPVYTTPPAQPAPVQPVQEPVGTYGEIFESMLSLLRTGLQRDQQIYTAMKDKPLYTTPPATRRPWVGLTDEDKLHIEIMGGKSDVMLAEMVEAKLKEKNT